MVKVMQQNLQGFQKDAVKAIYDFFFSYKKSAKMYISSGLGKRDIILNAICKIKMECPEPILVLVPRKEMVEDIIFSFKEMCEDFTIGDNVAYIYYHEFIVTTYEEIIREDRVNYLGNFAMIICDTPERLSLKDKMTIFNNDKTKCLAIISSTNANEKIVQEFESIYSYTIKDMMYNTNLKNQNLLEQFFGVFLDDQGFKKLTDYSKNTEFINWDCVAEKSEKKYIIEFKSYRNMNVNVTYMNELLKRIVTSKAKIDVEYNFLLVILGKVDTKLKEEALRFNIEIWDISNILYLCSENKELTELLISVLPYSVAELESEKPLNNDSIYYDKNFYYDKDNSFDNKISMVDTYKDRLENCKFGKRNNADKEYEKICNDIIIYLFRSEFYKISSQHQTEDKMFRMDLLCSLKGTTEFWKFLVNFYKTKFVVFEYKNYSENVTQNDIYVTEKYLFSVALRNVAFIISRKGFDKNARNAALGSLREHGYLIIDLTAEDLIKMIEMKENSEEPSDYLLDKVENLLMAVSK